MRILEFREWPLPKRSHRHPSVFDSGKTALVIIRSPLHAPSKRADTLVTRHKHDKHDDRQPQPPTGDHVRAGGEPDEHEKRHADNQAYVSDEDVNLFEVLDSLVARRKASCVFLGRIHFSDAQAFTSLTIFPKSELK